MNKDQSMTWELLLILGIVLVLISPVGAWMGNLVREIATFHSVNLNFNPLSSTSGSGAASGGGGTGSNALVGHYTVPLAGGGSMTVNASSQSAAVENVTAEGGTPATP